MENKLKNNPYETALADLSIEKNHKRATFGTLNMWRKVYLILVWFGTLLLSSIFFLGSIENGHYSLAIGLSIFLVGIAYWTHWAVVSRRVGHLTALAILNLFPGGNIIGCLIMFSIRRVTVKEINEFNIT